MTVTATPIFPQSIKNEFGQLNNASGQTPVTVYTGGTNGSKIESLFVSSTDTTARDIQISIVISSVTYILGTVTIPINSGNINSAPTVNYFQSSQLPNLAKDSNGNPYLYLASGAVLQAEALTTVTSGKVISIMAFGGDY